MDAPLVGIVMGSKSDEPVMRRAADVLEALEVPWEMRVSSAHRMPDATLEYARTAQERGLKVLIAGAGMAAALPGVVAAVTPLPVLGVPMKGSAFLGLDALLSIVQMPRGVPVGTLAVGEAGATNAGLLAARILALGDPELARRLERHRKELAGQSPPR